MLNIVTSVIAYLWAVDNYKCRDTTKKLHQHKLLISPIRDSGNSNCLTTSEIL